MSALVCESGRGLAVQLARVLNICSVFAVNQRPQDDLAILFFRLIINIFFREIRPRGTFNIPNEGPVIFVAAPHHNQVRERYWSAQGNE